MGNSQEWKDELIISLALSPSTQPLVRQDSNNISSGYITVTGHLVAPGEIN